MTVFKILVPKYFQGLYFKVITLQIGHHEIFIHYYVCKYCHNDVFCLVKYYHILQWLKFINFSLNISIILKSCKQHQKAQYFVNNIILLETIITNNFPLGYTHASRKYTHIIIKFLFVTTSVYNRVQHMKRNAIFATANVSGKGFMGIKMA